MDLQEKVMMERAQSLKGDELSKAVFAMMPVVTIRDIEKSKRTFKGTLNSARVDSYQSVVNPRGMRTDVFEQFGKPINRGHGHNEEIGQSVWINSNKERTQWDTMGRLVEGIQRADETLILMQEGIIKGLSVEITQIREQYFFDEAKVKFEEDYKDLGLRAEKDLNWYIRDWQLKAYAVCSTPANLDAAVRAMSGMSNETQEWVINSYMAQQFPVIKRELEEIKSQKFITERELDEKLQKMLDAGTGARPEGVDAGAGAKPAGMSVDRATYEKVLSYMREKKMMEEREEVQRMAIKKLNYLRGIVE